MEGAIMNSEVEIEAIRQLKYHYFRCVDQNKIDDLRNVMTEDCTAAYDNGNFAFKNRAEIIKFLSTVFPVPHMALHQGHHPEIRLVSDTEATGTWSFHDIVFYMKEKLRLEGSGFYSDRYRKVDGKWRISHTGYRRNFEVVTPLGEVKSWRSGVDEGLFKDS
jgi:hypothetical protein